MTIDKETILRIARESDMLEVADTVAGSTDELVVFVHKILSHHAESGVEVPEPHDYVWNPDGTFNIGQERCLSSNTGPCNGWEIYPIFTDDQLIAYGNARAAEALERAAKVCETEICDCCWDDDAKAAAEHLAEQIRSLTP